MDTILYDLRGDPLEPPYTEMEEIADYFRAALWPNPGIRAFPLHRASYYVNGRAVDQPTYVAALAHQRATIMPKE